MTLDRVARRLAELERRMNRAFRTPQLANSSIDAGALQVVDPEGQLTQIIGFQHDGTTTAAVVSGPVPPTPGPPIVDVRSGQFLVRWQGDWVDPQPSFASPVTAPMDFARVDVHAWALLIENPNCLEDPFVPGTVPGYGNLGSHTTLAPEFTIVDPAVPDGCSLKITTSAGATAGSDGATWTASGLVFGKTYTVSAAVYIPTASALARPKLVAAKSGSLAMANTTATKEADASLLDQWQRVSCSFVADDTDMVLGLRLDGFPASLSVYLDSVMVEPGSTANTYCDAPESFEPSFGTKRGEIVSPAGGEVLIGWEGLEATFVGVKLVAVSQAGKMSAATDVLSTPSLVAKRSASGRIQGGTTGALTVSAANTATTTTIFFPEAFKFAPTAVLLTPFEVATPSQVHYSVQNITETSFDVVLIRSNTSTTDFMWLAWDGQV